jgi:hypothetical protein
VIGVLTAIRIVALLGVAVGLVVGPIPFVTMRLTVYVSGVVNVCTGDRSSEVEPSPNDHK